MNLVNLARRLTRRQYFTETVHIQSGTTAVDRFGTETLTFATLNTVQGILLEVGGKEEQLYDRFIAVGARRERTAVLYAPYGTMLNENLYVLVNGIRWNVAAVVNDVSNATFMKALVYIPKTTTNVT